MNSTRLTIFILGLLLMLTAYQFYSNDSLQQQLDDYQAHVNRLQQELATHSEDQVAYETQINQLKREGQTQLSRISSLETELELAEEMIDPEVVALEQEIRQRVMLEARAESQRTTSRVNLVKELSSLDPMEMAQLMQIQGQYGRFLQSLNVDDERLEAITDALMNQISEQNQRRQELLQARMANPSGDMNSIRQQMIEISSPQAQREALSYIFTDEEMEMFDTFQQSQLNQQVPFGVSSRAVIADPSNGTVFFSGNSTLSTNDASVGAFQLIRVEDQLPPAEVVTGNQRP